MPSPKYVKWCTIFLCVYVWYIHSHLVILLFYISKAVWSALKPRIKKKKNRILESMFSLWGIRALELN